LFRSKPDVNPGAQCFDFETSGIIRKDEKFFDIHIAFGNFYGEHTGASWRSGTHMDVVGLGFNVWLESETGEEQIMREGWFLELFSNECVAF
jgi:hypothetical protein